MRKGVFYINGEKRKLELLKAGDRVKPKEEQTSAIGAAGTVQSILENGLAIVNWDEEKYPSKLGDMMVHLGCQRQINHLELI